MLGDGQVGLVQGGQQRVGGGKVPLGRVDKPAQGGAVDGEGQNAALARTPR